MLKCMALFLLLVGIYGCSEDDYEIFATIYGTVTDYQTGAPLENASIVLSPSGVTKQTDAGGNYRFEKLDVQQYVVTVQKTGYQPNRKTITAISGEALQVDIQLTIIPKE